MRKLVALIFVLALLAGVLAIVDVVARKGVESTVADRIESRSPGSHAVVTISSWPFLGHLAVSGTVPSLQADVTGVTDGSLHFERIDLHLQELKVSRGKLVHGQVQPLSITSGQVVAVVSQSSVDAIAHLPLSLGQGTIGVGGVTISVHLTIVDGAIVIPLSAGLPSLRLPVPDLDILPCVGTAQIVPGAVRLSCHFTTLPGLLAGSIFHA